ncbi:HTH_Tnp_Tc3_2 domain-containing protein [Trichonephila clavipes]|nr:HTH_Tnp_Tc3_2 domain-containing protein [Trichonephila clavipes]
MSTQNAYSLSSAKPGVSIKSIVVNRWTTMTFWVDHLKIRKYVGGGQKTRNRVNCKGQLALTVRGERWLRHIARSQRSQALAQITTQLYYGASRTVSKRTMQHSLHSMGFESRRPTRVSLLNVHHRAARLAWSRKQETGG